MKLLIKVGDEQQGCGCTKYTEHDTERRGDTGCIS